MYKQSKQHTQQAIQYNQNDCNNILFDIFLWISNTICQQLMVTLFFFFISYKLIARQGPQEDDTGGHPISLSSLHSIIHIVYPIRIHLQYNRIQDVQFKRHNIRTYNNEVQ